jgi:hypothetical protein
MRTWLAGEMPRTNVFIYHDDDGTVPLLEWLETLPQKARDKCRVKIERLRELGYELRRPEADTICGTAFTSSECGFNA